MVLQLPHTNSMACVKDEFVVLFAVGPLRRRPLNFFPVSEKVDVSCDASMLAEADTTTGLETD